MRHERETNVIARPKEGTCIYSTINPKFYYTVEATAGLKMMKKWVSKIRISNANWWWTDQNRIGT
jgi:hypothetical protein